MQEVTKQKKLKRGILIAFEGIDGSGKTIQSKNLLERLRQKGYPANRLKEPTDGVWGDKIRDLARNGRHKIDANTEFDFFLNDRKEDVNKNIVPLLNKKEIVIMDRYYFSSVAYQGARGLDTDFIEKKNIEIAPQPHLVILLDLSPKVALKRIIHSRSEFPDHFEREKYLEDVRKIFLKQLKGRPNAIIIEGDESKSTQAISQNIWDKIEPIIRNEEIQ